jgi:hypothetical protein
MVYDCCSPQMTDFAVCNLPSGIREFLQIKAHLGSLKDNLTAAKSDIQMQNK